MRKLRWRMRIEAVLASVSAFLFLLTLVIDEWVEAVFGVEPDAGSGVLEWAITIGFVGATVVLSLLARTDLRRLRQTAD